MAPSPSFEASTSMIIHQLNAVASARTEAWSGKTFVDIRFTTSSDKPWRTDALVTAHPVDTRSTVDARSAQTVIIIHLAQQTLGSRRAGAAERVDEIVACSAVLTWTSSTVINVELTVQTLQTVINICFKKTS